MPDSYIAVADILMDIEKELRELGLWESEPPSAEALASTQPFAIDTLTFSQWLQFVFIPGMYRLVENRDALPASCHIAPMGEEYFRLQPQLNSATLVAHLHRIDRLLTRKDG
ncbi:MAG TPA: YqcC family protein [Cellvibrionaceae bacterium]